jgi:signal transduction histidine kinase
MTPPESRPARLLQDIPLRVLLVGGFLIAGLIPLMILSLASYRGAHEELKRQAFRQLEAVREIKGQRVEHYFQERFADLRVFAATPSLQQAHRDCITARRQRDVARERELRLNLEPYVRVLLRQYGYSGFYLVDGANDAVLMAFDSGNPHSAPPENAPGPWQEALRRRDAVLGDIEPVDHDGSEVVQYLAVPLAADQAESGVIVARLSLDPVRRMMAEKTGMGRTGETYLVGADNRLRSDSRLDPQNRSLQASLAGSIANNGVQTESVARSLRGETGTAMISDYRGIPVLSAFAPLQVEGLAWVIVAEIDVAEIDRQIRLALTPQVLAITGGTALLLLILALVITHFIARNIDRVGSQLNALIDGVLRDRMDGHIDPLQVGTDFRAMVTGANRLVAAFGDHVGRIRKLEEHQRFTQQIEAIGTLASGIAHDFNNILTFLLAYARLALADTTSDSRVRENLCEIIAGIHRAGELVRRIMPYPVQALARPPRVDACQVCRETIAILKVTLPKKIVVQEHMEGRPLWIGCTPGAFQQIMLNLCTNAYHAMQDEGGFLRVSLVMLEQNIESVATNWVRLIVRDTGCGMDTEVRQRLFEPLFTTKPAGIGSGLGLSMVKETVESCGGRIVVHSEPGNGSEFIIDFPLLTGNVDCMPEVESVPSLPRRSVRILFVDDEEHIRLSEKRLLEELGFNTDTAANGQEALRMHAETPGRYQLVITDLNMPGINGIALSERLHQRDPDLPIFLITGYHELLQGINPAAVGIRTVLAKPFDMAELYEALQLIDSF